MTNKLSCGIFKVVKEKGLFYMTIDIASKLKERRRRMNLTQLELAKKVGVSESYICQIENGKMVSLKKLEQLAKVLGCKAKDLL